jgi:hypothetical protein
LLAGWGLEAIGERPGRGWPRAAAAAALAAALAGAVAAARPALAGSAARQAAGETSARAARLSRQITGGWLRDLPDRRGAARRRMDSRRADGRTIARLRLIALAQLY